MSSFVKEKTDETCKVTSVSSSQERTDPHTTSKFPQAESHALQFLAGCVSSAMNNHSEMVSITSVD